MALADWDPRLLSPERALHLAGDWPLYIDREKATLSQFGSQPDQWQNNLRCRQCTQSVLLIGIANANYGVNIGDLLSAVVRHMVTAHDLSLSGAPSG